MTGDVARLRVAEAILCALIAPDYEVDQKRLLFFCPRSASEAEDRLVVPEQLLQYFLLHYHTSLEGGHLGIGRSYQRIRANFHWRGLYRSVQRYVGECVDCETGKGRPGIEVNHPVMCNQRTPFRL